MENQHLARCLLHSLLISRPSAQAPSCGRTCDPGDWPSQTRNPEDRGSQPGRLAAALGCTLRSTWLGHQTEQRSLCSSLWESAPVARSALGTCSGRQVSRTGRERPRRQLSHAGKSSFVVLLPWKGARLLLPGATGLTGAARLAACGT